MCRDVGGGSPYQEVFGVPPEWILPLEVGIPGGRCFAVHLGLPMLGSTASARSGVPVVLGSGVACVPAAVLVTVMVTVLGTVLVTWWCPSHHRHLRT